ncbi:MAG: hypothetical protein ACP59X_20460 [Solidesulfovibrio sp. DCME]|uniref:hypothetical protein n=1 Tax=Solidesulfovibrio sp. DCME TaxID=3447380 RepID=UPI003D0F58C5
MQASYVSAASFTVAGDQTAVFAAGLRIQADCGADGVRYGTVASSSSYASATDVTTVTMTLDGAGLTAGLTAELHGNDLPASLCHHGHAGPADGGTVAHGTLSGAGTNSHAALDAFVASKAAASGLASLDAAALVVQNPANATATPAAGKIPIASASGWLTSWIEAASTAVAGIVELATNAIALAGMDTAKAITAAALWYVLTLATRLRISTNTTICVATTGSDTTGDGSAGAPYASIAKALSSIAAKAIDDGVVVTIQCADGTYTINSTVLLGHPDLDKIQILGNISAETTVSISAIDTTAKTITVAGDYTATLLVGDVFGVTGSSTANTNGAYKATSVSYADGYTTIGCSGDTVASATVGGGSLVIKPCNRCLLNFTGSHGFTFASPHALYGLRGFRIVGTSSYRGIYSSKAGFSTVGSRVVLEGWGRGIFIGAGSVFDLTTVYFYNTEYGAVCYSAIVNLNASCVFSKCTTAISQYRSNTSLVSSPVFREVTTNYSPALNTVGNGNAYITNA